MKKIIVFIFFSILLTKVSSFDKEKYCDCRPLDEEIEEQSDSDLNLPFLVSIGRLDFSLDFTSK